MLTVLISFVSVSGLVCASNLRKFGFSVYIFDMGRGPGGRMSQRRSVILRLMHFVSVLLFLVLFLLFLTREILETGEALRFDHGVQKFHIKNPSLFEEFQKWRNAKVVKAWEGRFGILDAQNSTFEMQNASSKYFHPTSIMLFFK